ncbi:hypothetical protein AWZ03_006108 [Drosophila navojoa]|uniref:Uncharacterized protein n=1 Tax=Drosophila navojoa TaxID=7232 RepID=A0A484BF87_DRONA|nr:hypothetical protein AWZ03_006108 [Drosophila navojoa]
MHASCSMAGERARSGGDFPLLRQPIKSPPAQPQLQPGAHGEKQEQQEEVACSGYFLSLEYVSMGLSARINFKAAVPKSQPVGLPG